MIKNKNYKIFLPKLITTGFLLFSVVFILGQTASAIELPSGTTQVQVKEAMDELSQLTGQTITNEEQAKNVCDSEKYLTECLNVGKKYNLYSKEEVKDVNTFLGEIKGKIAEELKNCSDTSCLIEVANRLARSITAKAPQLAKSLDLTNEKIKEKQQIISAARETGVDFLACKNMDPDTASVELLRSCAKLALDPRVNKFLGSQEELALQSVDSTLDLRLALTNGQASCGGTTSVKECGNYCLKPKPGVTEIPKECSLIAEKFFGPEGVSHLQEAYSQVKQINDFYAKKSDSLVFTTEDGKTLTSLDDIGDYCEAGQGGNFQIAKKCLGFARSNNFISLGDADLASKFIEQAQAKGGKFDFNKPNQDSNSFRDFIPQEQREEFEAGNQIQNIMKESLGFDPRECQQKNCVEGTKIAIEKIKALNSQSPFVQDTLQMLQRNVARADEFNQRKNEIQSTFNTQNGPGGCKSYQECSAYCSDPTHSPECIAFGSQKEIPGFKGQEAVQKFSDFNQTIQQGFEGNFPGQGPYSGFIPPGQDGIPPGQQPGFTQPGPGFNQSPSPECFKAIQSGDFVKAKELCVVNLPQNNVSPIEQTQSQPLRTAPCPALATVNECPVGQIKAVTYSSPECGTYYTCQPADTTSRTPCPAGQYWNGNNCVTDSYNTDPAVGCRQAGGAWDEITKFCNMPGSTNCSSGQYWNGTACVSSQPSGQKTQTWNSFGLSSQIRTDADPARIESLKQACANVRSGASIWMPGAGDYSSPDFGMPNPDKCKIATNCNTGEFFDGANCVSKTSTSCDSSAARVSESACLAISGCKWLNNDCMYSAYTTVTCSSGQWWDSATQLCKTYTTSGTGCSSSTAQASQSACLASGNCNWFNSACSPSTSATTCPSGYYMGSNGTCVVSTTTTTCPSGQHWYTPSSGAGYCISDSTTTSTTCPSGQNWYTPPGGGSGYCQSQSAACTQTGGIWNSSTSSCQMPACPTGQYWYTPPSGGTGSCVSNTSTATTCPSGYYMGSNGTCVVSTTTTACPSGQHWYTPSSGAGYCISDSTTACPSGQYWNGTSCMTSSTTACSSGQYWNGSACVSSTTTTTCPSDQYWNGTACVTNPVTSPSTTCGSGLYWNGSACVSSTTTTTTTCSSDQYWNGTSCVSSAPPPSPMPTQDPATTCAQAGGTWNGATCQMSLIPSQSTLAAISGVVSQLIALLRSLFQ